MVRDPDRDVEREAERDQQEIGREDEAHGREARCAIGWRGAAERQSAAAPILSPMAMCRSSGICPLRFEETLSISWRVGASARARVGRFGGTGLFGCEEGDAIGGTSLVTTAPEAFWAITVSAGVSTDRAQNRMPRSRGGFDSRAMEGDRLTLSKTARNLSR